MNEAVMIESYGDRAPDDQTIARFTMLVYPIPADALVGLGVYLRDMTVKYLSERQIVSGEVIDLSGRGPLQ